MCTSRKDKIETINTVSTTGAIDNSTRRDAKTKREFQ